MAEMPWMPALPPGIPLYRNSAGDTVMSYTEEMTRAYAKAYAAAAVAAEREAIIALLPGGDHVDPQWVADAIRGRE